VLLDLARSHSRVAVDFCSSLKTFMLSLTRPTDPVTNRNGILLLPRARDVAILDRRYFNVKIDPIKKGPRYSLPITLHLCGTATAFPFQVAKIPARTGIQATPHLSMNQLQ
jgi:hypothetical protein